MLQVCVIVRIGCEGSGGYVRQEDATLVTSDGHFEGLPGVVYFSKGGLSPAL